MLIYYQQVIIKLNSNFINNDFFQFFFSSLKILLFDICIARNRLLLS